MAPYGVAAGVSSDRDILEMGSIGCFFCVFFGWAMAGLAVALGFYVMNEEM